MRNIAQRSASILEPAGTAVVIRLPTSRKPQAKSPKPRKTLAQRFSEKVDRSGGLFACWPWTGSTMQSNGYGQISDISPKTGKRSMRCAHVVAYELANGPVPEGKRVLHARGCCQLCCNHYHLRAGTAAENTADARAEGRLAKRLTVEQAIEIARIYRERGVSIKNLAARFDVSTVSITNIIRGKTYSKHTGIERNHGKGGRPPKLRLVVSNPEPVACEPMGAVA